MTITDPQRSPSASVLNGRAPASAEERLLELHKLRDRIEAEIQELEDAIVRVSLARAKAIAEGAVRRRRRKRATAMCGTPSGYYRHRRTLQEPACEECKAAHRIAEAIRVEKRRAEAATGEAS